MTPRRVSPPALSRPRGLLALIAVVLTAVMALSACDPPPTPPDPPGGGAASAGLWIDPSTVPRLPMDGPAWTRLASTAHGDWGSPSLSDNNATHDTSTLAGALVAVRTGDDALRAKTRTAIMAVTRVTAFARVLELSRNITSYVIAADLVTLSPADDTVFRRFVADLRTRPLSGHSGGDDLVSTALRSGNNWGTMARAAVTAIDLYLDDEAGVREVAAAHRAWLGDPVANQLVWTDTRWHTGSPRAGINPRGATLLGHDVDGVIPEDQRRTGEPSASPPPRGSYPWEALQGALVTGVLLDRAGVVDIAAGDQALARAFTWLYAVNDNPPVGDDAWQPWVLNQVAGTHFATTPASSVGKNMGWSDWTHGPGA